MSTDEVLSQLDAAVSDWETSPDAMRCNRVAPIERTWQPPYVGPPPAHLQHAAPTVPTLLAELAHAIATRLPWRHR